MSEDDGIKRVRGDTGSGVTPGETPPGARPRRLKGFYRAVRRGESWAVAIDKKTGLDRMFALHFIRVDWAAEIAKPSLFDFLPKDDCWKGAFFTVPLRFGK